jgi:hypothetical protein
MHSVMRKTTVVMAVSAVAIGLLAGQASSQTKAASGFDQLKALAGTWEAKTSEGTTINTIRLVSNDSAIQETFQSKDGKMHNQMITMYSPDGDRVALTHYCSLGNQPHMETGAVSDGQREFDFSFTGAGNLPDAKGPHMHHLTLRIEDADHFSETWTMSAGGNEQTVTFHFVRGKA